MMILFAAGVVVLGALAVYLVTENKRLRGHLATSDALCDKALQTGKALAHHANELRIERDGLIYSLISLANNVQKYGLEVPNYESILRYASETEVKSLLAETVYHYSDA